MENPKTDTTTTTKRFWTPKKKMCAIGALVFIVLFLVIFLPILFLVIGPKVAQSSINSSVLTFREATITNPQNTTFDLYMRVDVSDAGHSKATVTHTTPMTVAWISPKDGSEIPILSMELPPFSVSGGDGVIETTVKGVKILSQPALTMFNQFLIGREAFQWKLSSGVSVHALSRDYDGLTMNKIVDVKGMNGFNGNTTIREYEIDTSKLTEKEIPITMTATIPNPSPVGLELDATVFDVATMNGIPLGRAVSEKVMVKGSALGPTALKLTGTLYELALLPAELRAVLSKVVLGVVNVPVQVTPISVGGANPVSWIAGALIGAHLNATMGKA